MNEVSQIADHTYGVHVVQQRMVGLHNFSALRENKGRLDHI